MFRFEDISYMYGLLVIPVLLGVFFLLFKWRKGELQKIGELQLVNRLLPGKSDKRQWLKYGMLLSGLTMLMVAAANPQMGTKKEKVKAQSADIFIAFDISQSMSAQDISPSRLERAKRFTEKLIRSLKGDRIGLIFFAGDAYLQMPLTNDYAAAELSIKSASPSLAGLQGTAIDEAIDMAQRAYEGESRHQRALIIISDGEDHDADAVAKAEEAKEDGLVIYTIGVGTEQGAYVPFVNRGRSEFKKDETGAPVMSRLNIPNLQNIARAGNGEFYLVSQADDAISDMKTKMSRLQRREVEVKSFSQFNSYYQWFLTVGFLLLLVEWILPQGIKPIFLNSKNDSI